MTANGSSDARAGQSNGMESLQGVPFVGFEIDLAPGAWELVSGRIDAFAQEQRVPSGVRDRIRLGVGEVTQALSDALPGTPGRVLVEADVDQRDLQVVLTHDGATALPDVSQLSSRCGTAIARCDGFATHRHAPNAIEVWMSFRVDGAGGHDR